MELAVKSIITGDYKQIPDPHIDREKTCPMLLRVFCNIGRHNHVVDYSGGNVPPNELQIYAWMDTTLKELTTLIEDVYPDAREEGTSFAFSFVTPQHKGFSYRMRPIGVIYSGKTGKKDNKTLAQSKFIIGNYVDISITPPNRVQPIVRGGNFRQ